jgi:hypothetical protein
MLRDRARYATEVEENTGNAPRRVQAIDLVRRLAKNTEPVAEKPPKTSNEQLNIALADIETPADELVESDLLGKALMQMNIWLLDCIEQEEIGIEPNTILAIGWLERKAFHVMQALTFEQQSGLIKKPWFRSLLLFQDLTWTPGQQFDRNEFNTFLQACEKTSSEGEAVQGNPFEEGYVEKLQQAYAQSLSLRLIAERTREHASALARKYTVEKRPQWVGALWSGNVAHELIGLIEQREASTALGKRIMQERRRPMTERPRGD